MDSQKTYFTWEGAFFQNPIFNIETRVSLLCTRFYFLLLIIITQDSLFSSVELLSIRSCLPSETPTKEPCRISSE